MYFPAFYLSESFRSVHIILNRCSYIDIFGSSEASFHIDISKKTKTITFINSKMKIKKHIFIDILYLYEMNTVRVFAA